MTAAKKKDAKPAAAGIEAFGAYVPMTRLPLAVIGGGKPTDGGPEKAVAGHDEDSVTMAVAAAIDCLRGVEREDIDALFFASTTNPYREKQAAALVCKALDLRREVRAADLGTSLRAGTTALLSAVDAVRAGSARKVLVVASDCRMAEPRSAMERNLGDGAVALLVGSENPVATFEAQHTISEEIIDLWRAEDDRFVRSWEERFVVKEGYLASLGAAVEGLLENAGLAASDITKAAVFAPDARSHKAATAALGLGREQTEDPLFGRLGNCGAAFSLLLLVAALEKAAPGERLLVASYGDGAEALLLTTTDELAQPRSSRGLAWHLDRRRQLASYDSYLAGRGLMPSSTQDRGGTGISATRHFRERDDDISFRGHRCRGCGTLHFPAQRVCYNCFRRDDFEAVRLSDTRGRVLSYTFDHFFPNPEPPTIAGMVETEAGCRLYLMMADARPEQLRCDLPVEFCFRKIHEAGGRPNYFWKSFPAEGATADGQGDPT